MGMRFRKSINLGGGTKLNISKSGIGVSTGVKGFRKSVNTSGRARTTMSIPGTGVSYVKETGSGTRHNAGRKSSGFSSNSSASGGSPKKPFFQRALVIILSLLLLAPLGIFLLWKNKKEWPKLVKILLSIIFGAIWLLLLIPTGDSENTDVPEDRPAIVEKQESEEPKEEDTQSEIDRSIPRDEEELGEADAQESSALPVIQDEDQEVEEPEVKEVEEPEAEEKINHEKETDGVTVYITPTGSKYHLDQDCGGENSTATTLESAENRGYGPCKKCAQ